MNWIGMSPESGPPSAMRKWGWLIGAIVALLVILIIATIFPRLIAVYELFWGKENIQRLFYEDLGLSESWSAFIGVVASFFYALAWVPLSLWTYRITVWRFNSRQLAIAFGCWVLVYGHVPLLHALLGSDACFNQRSGVPLKWYVQDPDGRIVIFDSPGFDSVTRAEKKPVTPDVCAAVARQKIHDRPRRMTAAVQQIEFFDPTNGHARVWYSRTAEGGFDLFDAPGFHPVTSEPLLPVTKEVAAEILNHARKEIEDARKLSEAAEARRRAEAEAAEVRRRAAEVERRRIEADAHNRDALEQTRRRNTLEQARNREAASSPFVPGTERLFGRVAWYGIYTTSDSKEIKDPTSPTGSRFVSTPIAPRSNTADIPGKQIRFGMSYVLSGGPGQMTVKHVYRFPPPGMPDNQNGGTRTTYEFTRRDNMNEGVLMGWSFEGASTQQIVPGEWIFEVWAGNRMVVEKHFNVVSP